VAVHTGYQFPVFLAACRLKLPDNTHAPVREVYDCELHLADQWLKLRGLVGHHTIPGTPRHTRALSIRLSRGPTGLGLIICGNTAPTAPPHLPTTGSPYITDETRYLTVPWTWRTHHPLPTEVSAL
jgi:hypothetical protein